MTSARYLGHVTLLDGCDWLKSAANFPLSIDQTLLLPLTVALTTYAVSVTIVSANNLLLIGCV